MHSHNQTQIQVSADTHHLPTLPAPILFHPCPRACLARLWLLPDPTVGSVSHRVFKSVHYVLSHPTGALPWIRRIRADFKCPQNKKSSRSSHSSRYLQGEVVGRLSNLSRSLGPRTDTGTEEPGQKPRRRKARISPKLKSPGVSRGHQ